MLLAALMFYRWITCSAITNVTRATLDIQGIAESRAGMRANMTTAETAMERRYPTVRDGTLHVLQGRRRIILNAGSKSMSTEHVHQFRLPPPNGPIAVGVCSCGERREMWNSLDPGDRISGHWRAVSDRTKTGKRRMSVEEMRAVEASKKATMMNLSAAVSGTMWWE